MLPSRYTVEFFIFVEFYQTWQIHNCTNYHPLRLWNCYHFICGQIIYTTLLTCRLLLFIPDLIPRWDCVCLTHWEQTQLILVWVHPLRLSLLLWGFGQACVDSGVSRVSPVIHTQCCANQRVSTHINGAHTYPTYLWFIVKHDQNGPEFCRHMSRTLSLGRTRFCCAIPGSH